MRLWQWYTYMMNTRSEEKNTVFYSYLVSFVNTTACSLITTTPTPTLTLTTTAMQMLPLMAATSFEHRGPQCLLTLIGRSTSPHLHLFPVHVCSCPPCTINRMWILEYVRVSVIYRVHQTEYVIHILVATSQEYRHTPHAAYLQGGSSE